MIAPARADMIMARKVPAQQPMMTASMITTITRKIRGKKSVPPGPDNGAVLMGQRNTQAQSLTCRKFKGEIRSRAFIQRRAMTMKGRSSNRAKG